MPPKNKKPETPAPPAGDKHGEVVIAVGNYIAGRNALAADQLDDSEELHELWDALERATGADIDVRAWQHETGENNEDWEINEEAAIAHIERILSGRAGTAEEVYRKHDEAMARAEPTPRSAQRKPGEDPTITREMV